jgi:integrase
MGSKWFIGGIVTARRRIQFDFTLDGIRYRPSIRRPPSEANLRRARERLEEIKREIEHGTFSFAEEFPDYRFLHRITGVSRARSCNDVFDEFLAHCEARLTRGDMAGATLSAYRRVLNSAWRPELGTQLFRQVRYSRLVAIADSKPWSKKTYNNAISILRRAFDLGYQDHPEQHNPARSLRSARLKKKDRPKIDPFCTHDAEALIAAIHREWGEAQGNYDEFRFFTGMRPSEQIALVSSDLDLVNGIVSVNKARVAGIDRCKTKTGEDRRIALCPRALSVLKRQLQLRARLQVAGKLNHDQVFFQETGEPYRNLQHPGTRWRKTLSSLKLRYRRPYTARHSSVSWNLMIGKNALWVAKQHGHSIATMLRVYAAWADGAVESDIEAITRSMDQITAGRASVRTRERCRYGRRSVWREGSSPVSRNLAVDLSLGATRKSQVTEWKRKVLAEREGFEGFRPTVGSASYGFGNQFCSHRSPEIPIAVTGAVTGNPSFLPGRLHFTLPRF